MLVVSSIKTFPHVLYSQILRWNILGIPEHVGSSQEVFAFLLRIHAEVWGCGQTRRTSLAQLSTQVSLIPYIIEIKNNNSATFFMYWCTVFKKSIAIIFCDLYWNIYFRVNTVRKPIEMTADMVHECLCLKAEQAWSDMVRTFRSFDADGNGIITRRDLRALLFRWNNNFF